jgi:hypothetical protein
MIEGPKEITVPVHTYNSCQHCKYFVKEGFYAVDTRTNEFEFKCGHPDRTVKGLKALLWSSRQLQQIEFKVRIETPDWCPYLDSNNVRKVLVEKDMNKEGKE